MPWPLSPPRRRNVLSVKRLHGRIEYKWLVAICFVTGLFMEILDTTIINTAIPSLTEEFDASPAGIEWVILGYLLALAVFIPASGWIGDRFGTKKTFLFALTMFTGASVLCGFAQSLEQLIGFRLLQGVGGGMLTPIGTAMLYRAFPPEERARASAVLIVPTVIAPALGPLVGGFIVTHFSWRWIFYVNIPVGIFGILFAATFLKEHCEMRSARFDGTGFVLSGAGLAGLLYALSYAPTHGWLSGTVLVTGLGGLVLLALMVKVETTVAEPMLALRLYRDRIFRNGNIAGTLSYGSFIGFIFLLPQFIQGPLDASAFESGLATFPQAIGVIAMSQFVGRWYHTVGPRRLVTFGMLMAALATLPFALLDQNTSLGIVALLMFLRGCFMAFCFMPIQTATYANIDAPDTGRAAAIFSTQRQTSAALGVAVLATVFVSRTNHGLRAGREPAEALSSGYHWGFVAASIIYVLGALWSWTRIKNSDAVRTMQPRPKEQRA
ncbi:MAG: multidrug efflux MFS transporter [Actinobacteria bacterium]|nr:multidrug efflux MFS transporter [Actinomycetota bacterium]